MLSIIKSPSESNVENKTCSLLFSFNLKGAMSDVNKAVKVLTRIETPTEILNQETPKGKLLWKKYAQINKDYEALKKRAMKHISDDPVFLGYPYGLVEVDKFARVSEFELSFSETIGLNGVASDAKLYAYRVCDSGGSCPNDAIIAAVERAMDPNDDMLSYFTDAMFGIFNVRTGVFSWTPGLSSSMLG